LRGLAIILYLDGDFGAFPAHDEHLAVSTDCEEDLPIFLWLEGDFAVNLYHEGDFEALAACGGHS